MLNSKVYNALEYNETHKLLTNLGFKVTKSIVVGHPIKGTVVKVSYHRSSDGGTIHLYRDNVANERL